MSNLYTDHPHEITYRTKHGKRWVYKSVKNKTIQFREYQIQRWLYSTGFVPYCEDYTDSGYWEEHIPGKSINQLNDAYLNTRLFVQLTDILQTIHQLTTPTEIIQLFPGANPTYDPKYVYDLIVDQNESMLPISVRQQFQRQIHLVNQQLKQIDYQKGIIHGDLSANNIMVTPDGKIRIIDWTDSRYDLGICDIVQLSHLWSHPQKYAHILRQNYQSNANFPEMIKLQSAFFQLYDLMQSYKIQSQIDHVQLIKLQKILQT